jgi:hypothetical protein
MSLELSDSVLDAADSAKVQAAKNAADNRKWIASKLLPRKYGERTIITGANNTPLIPPSTATPDRVAAVFLAFAEKLFRPGPRHRRDRFGIATSDAPAQAVRIASTAAAQADDATDRAAH